mmetsp:Transcript_106003/g.167374  ORF Transcript_106003/g.167374 Transcript_106003/m.167374 type:complete len:807 (+) Transcript_106003:77-2497(+)
MAMDKVQAFLKTQDLDEATLSYLVAVLEDASADEWKEVAEPYLEADSLDALVALAPASTSSAFSPPARGPPTLDRNISVVPDLPKFEVAPKLDETRSSSSEGEGETKRNRLAKVDRKVRERQERQKQKGDIAKDQSLDANTVGRRKDEEVVEITAQVSRFHKEAVENEITSAVSEVDIHDLTMVVAGNTLFEDAHLKLCAGQRYGFIGRNGCGKSTLLRAMADKRIPGYPAQCVTLLVAQEDIGDERNPVDVVVSADAELVALLDEEQCLLASETGDPVGATKALRAHTLLKAREELRRAAAYESKMSGQRGREARKVLLEAEAREREAAAACEKDDLDPEAQGLAADLLADIRDRLRILDIGAMKGRAESLLKGLGFSSEDLRSPTLRLSGGWRMRIALAKALFTQPNVLLLDEPTNHLDWTATLWLEKYLQTSDMENVALVVVSHDRAFLDNVCTMILRTHERKLHLHDGNYSAFEKAHKEDQEHRADLAARVAEKRATVEKQVQAMEQRGRKTGNDNLLKQVASRKTKMGMNGPQMTAFNRIGLEGVDGHKWKSSYSGNVLAEAAMATESKEAEVKLKIKSAAPLGNESAMAQCREVVVGYESGKPLINKFDLDIRMGSRIGLLGVNGSGKTTLLRTLLKELNPLKGEVYLQPRVVISFFNQHQADALPLSMTAVESLRERFPETTEAEVRSHLGAFGVGRQAVQSIGSLSGGEKNRVALAAITFRPPHILVLDEPTNHLDLQTVEALGKALQEFPGGLVIASHDRRLLKEVCKEFYGIQGKRLQKTDLTEFVKAVRSGAAAR